MIYPVRPRGQLIDEDLMNWWMEQIMLLTVYKTMEAMIQIQIQADRDKVEQMIGHLPSPENMEDFYSLQREIALKKKSLQRELDKEKMRHHLMGLETI